MRQYNGFTMRDDSPGLFTFPALCKDSKFSLPAIAIRFSSSFTFCDVFGSRTSSRLADTLPQSPDPNADSPPPKSHNPRFSLLPFAFLLLT